VIFLTCVNWDVNAMRNCVLMHKNFPNNILKHVSINSFVISYIFETYMPWSLDNNRGCVGYMHLFSKHICHGVLLYHRLCMLVTCKSWPTESPLRFFFFFLMFCCYNFFSVMNKFHEKDLSIPPSQVSLLSENKIIILLCKVEI